jgi:hypothetical protein
MKIEKYEIEKYGGRKCDWALSGVLWMHYDPELPFGATAKQADKYFQKLKKKDPTGKYRIIKETWEVVKEDKI